MEHTDNPPSQLMDILRDKLGNRMDKYTFPPPIFNTMKGKFIKFDQDIGYLAVQFPILESYLNPYGAMQGGMIAAAVDNVLGPLSVLVAPPNVTRHLEMKYSRPVTLEMEHIIVEARLLEREGYRLFFKADVRSQDGLRLARSKAVHWILAENGK